MKNNSQITVAVVYHNEEAALPMLLGSLEKAIVKNNIFQFLFLNNDSSDASESYVKDWCIKHPQFESRMIHRMENHLAKARSQAIDLCDTEWLAFLDADVVVDSTWAAKSIEALENLNDKVVVMGGAERRDGNESWHRFARRLVEFFPFGKNTQSQMVVRHVPTNNYFVKTSAAKKVGGFDARFRYVGEDLEMNVRLRQQGLIVYEPSVLVDHPLPKSLRLWFKKMRFYGQAQSMVFLKHLGGVPIQKFAPLLLVLSGLVAFLAFPLFAASALFLCLLLPRTRFFIFSVFFYGIGEFEGIFKYFYQQMSFENFEHPTHKAKENLGIREKSF